MFYRRKIILALLQLFNGQLDKIRIQKLIFLITQGQRAPVFEFIPYKFGSFSYSLTADLSAMVRNGLLAEDGDEYVKIDGLNYITQIKGEDKKFITSAWRAYGSLSSDELMRYTYLNLQLDERFSNVIKKIADEDKLLEIEDFLGLQAALGSATNNLYVSAQHFNETAESFGCKDLRIELYNGAQPPRVKF